MSIKIFTLSQAEKLNLLRTEVVQKSLRMYFSVVLLFILWWVLFGCVFILLYDWDLVVLQHLNMRAHHSVVVVGSVRFGSSSCDSPNAMHINEMTVLKPIERQQTNTQRTKRSERTRVNNQMDCVAHIWCTNTLSHRFFVIRMMPISICHRHRHERARHIARNTQTSSFRPKQNKNISFHLLRRSIVVVFKEMHRIRSARVSVFVYLCTGWLIAISFQMEINTFAKSHATYDLDLLTHHLHVICICLCLTSFLRSWFTRCHGPILVRWKESEKSSLSHADDVIECIFQ